MRTDDSSWGLLFSFCVYLIGCAGVSSVPEPVLPSVAHDGVTFASANGLPAERTATLVRFERNALGGATNAAAQYEPRLVTRSRFRGAPLKANLS